jgi:hypothetical protein
MPINSEPKVIVKLNLNESGTLCNMMMRAFATSGGYENQPVWVQVLYTKLANANDRLRR